MTRQLKEVATWALLGGMTVGGIHLVQRNHTLAQQNQALIRVIEPHAGRYVPPYPVTTLSGAPVTLGALGHRQVLIFFRTTCPYCQASTPAFNTIAERLAPDSLVPVYGVALDSAGAARTYAAQHALRFPVIAQLNPRLVGLYRVTSVPLVLVVNEQGRLAYARPGVLQSAAAVDSVVRGAEAPAPAVAATPHAPTQAHKKLIAPY